MELTRQLLMQNREAVYKQIHDQLGGVNHYGIMFPIQGPPRVKVILAPDRKCALTAALTIGGTTLAVPVEVEVGEPVLPQGATAENRPDAATCTHTNLWAPVRGWGGRYRCGGCGVFGYRAVVTADPHADVKVGSAPKARRHGGDDSRFIPYQCAREAQGKRCGAPATYVNARVQHSARCAQCRALDEAAQNKRPR